MAGVSILSFLLIAVSNTDPAEVIARRSAGGATEEMIEAIRVQLGLDKPLFVRYIKWLGGLLTGNLGIFALAVPVICSFIRLFRSLLLSELSRDYVVYARARGLSPERILLRHVMRNAMPPLITLFCQYLGYLIAGGAVVENVFSLSGIGSYLISCVLAADATAVASCIIIIAAVFVLANLAGDVINRLLCPWMVRETNA